MLRGEELLSQFESSPGIFRVFCGRCGSPLFKRTATQPSHVRLRLGCLDTSIDERPMGHVFVRSKPEWSSITDGLPQFDTVPDKKSARS